jgi:hypothetical protein
LLLQDTSGTAAAQAKYAAAATAAQQHANKVQQLLKSSSSSSSSNVPAGAGCWQQVQTAAHHLLSTYRAASMRLQLLSSLLEGREQLLHQIQQAQVDAYHPQQQQRPQQQQHFSPTRHSTSGSRIGCESASVLTAFELHLLASPQLLQQHQQALQQGCNMLQQQLQCVQAAQTFFAWASSVLDEEQNVPVPGTSAEGTTAAAAHALGSRHGQHQSAPPPARQKQQQQSALLPEPKVADLLPLLQQLPAADSPLAAKVLLRVTQQLQAAAIQAGIELGADTTGSAADGLAALSLSSAAGFAGSSSSSSVQLSEADVAVLSSFGKVAAAAMVASGLVPSAEPALLQLPADIQQQLDSQTGLRRQQQQLNDAGRQEQVTAQLEQHWRRQQVSDQRLQELMAQLQLQQQQQQGVGSAAPDALLTGTLPSGQAAAAARASCVAAAAEVQRLHGLALQIARQLAKTRAANKQQMQVAGQLLIGQGEAAAAAAAGSAEGPSQLLLFKK